MHRKQPAHRWATVKCFAEHSLYPLSKQNGQPTHRIQNKRKKICDIWALKRQRCSTKETKLISAAEGTKSRDMRQKKTSGPFDKEMQRRKHYNKIKKHIVESKGLQC